MIELEPAWGLKVNPGKHPVVVEQMVLDFVEADMELSNQRSVDSHILVVVHCIVAAVLEDIHTHSFVEEGHHIVGRHNLEEDLEVVLVEGLARLLDIADSVPGQPVSISTCIRD